MSEKKYLVPSEMSRAAWVAMDAHVKTHGPAVGCQPGSMCSLTVGLEAAIRWMADNAPKPERSQCEAMWRAVDNDGAEYCREWVRRMFEAPEPEVPDAIADLIPAIGTPHRENWTESVIEAYRRGKAGK